MKTVHFIVSRITKKRKIVLNTFFLMGFTYKESGNIIRVKPVLIKSYGM